MRAAKGSQHIRWYEAIWVQTAKCAIGMFAVVAMLASFAAAQATSQLNGIVTDQSGASVSGAKISLTDTATGLQRTTTSNGDGLYQFPPLP